MPKVLLAALLFGMLSAPAPAQQAATEAEIRRQVPYSPMRQSIPGLTLAEYNKAIRDVARAPADRRPMPRNSPERLGRLTTNPYLPDSSANAYGRYGNPYAPNSLNNPFGRYGNPFSPNSPNNPFALDTPRLYGNDGTYLGKLSGNPYDPDSTANPFGRYGNPYSPDSIKNPYGIYGNPYSPLSPTNPYTTTPPLIFGSDPW